MAVAPASKATAKGRAPRRQTAPVLQPRSPRGARPTKPEPGVGTTSLLEHMPDTDFKPRANRNARVPAAEQPARRRPVPYRHSRCGPPRSEARDALEAPERGQDADRVGRDLAEA